MLTKKFLKLVLVLTVGLLLSVANASAFELLWDTQEAGTGGTDPYTTSGFQLTQSNTDSSIIIQDASGFDPSDPTQIAPIVGDAFTETITLTIANGKDENGDDSTPDFGLDQYFKMELSLAGIVSAIDAVTNAPTITFQTGTGSIMDYYTSAGANIMDFSLIGATPVQFTGSLYSPTTLSAFISLGFEITDVNTPQDNIDNGTNLSTFDVTASSSSPIDDLIGSQFLLAFAEGSFAVASATDDETTTPPTITYVTTTNGVRARFDVVPEPTTMLLFGFGLLGLAGIGRKRA